MDATQKPRPILVKFENQVQRNLVLQNCYKLKKSELFKRVILCQDLSKEDREECKRLLTNKKREIDSKDDASKWIFRVRGQPGNFHVVTYRRQSL